MTSSVIYYSTDARKNEIYLLNNVCNAGTNVGSVLNNSRSLSENIREVKIYVYGKLVTANAKLQVGFEGKFYKFWKVSTSF